MNILHKIIDIFFAKELNSIIEENNIIGKFDKYNIVTKDENFLTMFELEGIPYSSKNDEELKKYFHDRNTFLKKVDTMFNISIFQKRGKSIVSLDQNSYNPYAQQILNKWNEVQKDSIFQNRYYISISTRNKNILDFLKKKRESLTTSKNTSNVYLNDKLNDLAKDTLIKLKAYKIRRLTSDEVLSFYASYMNMKETNVKAVDGLLRDSYINSNIKFHRDYIEHESLTKRYSRFVTVKAYDTEIIDSNLTSDLLNVSSNLMICENLQNISKEKALRKLDYLIVKAIELIKEQLLNLSEEVQSDRETIINFTYTILITEDSVEDLNETTIEIENIYSKYGIQTVVENINLKTIYMSFFPSRDNLNARKRYQTSSAISVLNPLEKDFIGYDKNSLGNKPVTLFKTLNNTPYKFNFHVSDKEKALGHTIVIADSESGKTTLITFLLCCCMQYDINILALDKLNGMYIFTKFLNGDYADINEEFKLNPFSLEDTKVNRIFLTQWIKSLANISNDDSEMINDIQNGIDMIYQNKIDGDIITFSDFMRNVQNNDELSIRLETFRGGIFDNEICMLDFENHLTTLAMDNILKDSKIAFLAQLYIGHKLQEDAKAKGKGFVQFYDEFKDYVTEKDRAELILEQQVERRKINGTSIVNVQNLDFFNELGKKDSMLDSFGHYIIFPTSSEQSLKKLQEQLNLNETEMNFLRTSDSSNFEILLKNRKSKESVFLNVDLSALGDYLKFFNSDANEVLRLKELLKTNPNNWREEF